MAGKGYAKQTENGCVKRLQKEFLALCRDPVPQVVACPSPTNILDWHYVLEGSEGTPFAGGYYYGILQFPPDYPFKPPGISMITPNGRFMTQKKICLSMSDFHPETWNPMWSVSSILTGLLSFMLDESPTTGSVRTTLAEKQRLAKASLAFNCKNRHFRELFPQYVEKHNQRQQQLLLQQAEQAVSPTPDTANSAPANPKDANKPKPDPPKNTKKNKAQLFPTWLLLLLFSIFGVVMALPLLQP